MTLVYKILSAQAWAAAEAQGRFEGAAVDLQDGYIHLSSAEQAQETAARHFHGQADLVLAVFDSQALGAALRWEPSRGGALFPHLYAPLDVSLALEVRPLSLGADGVPELGL
jgi:uncharacterized protein (DUF952 family)